MKNNPNKATIEEITRLYHYIILPLLVEIDQNLNSKKISNKGCVASFHKDSAFQKVLGDSITNPPLKGGQGDFK